MCHAVSLVISYLRLISHAETEFFDGQTSNITSSHVRMLIFVPWKIVSVRTRVLLAAVPAFPHPALRRLAGAGLTATPLAGFRKYCRPTAPHFGHDSGPSSPHRRSSSST